MNPTPQYYIASASSETHTGMEKRGSQVDDTHAAHKLSHRVAKAGLDGERGRPLNTDNVIPHMNAEENLRIKSSYGNQVLDERRDRRLEQALRNGESNITEKSTFNRAAQNYDGACHVAQQYEEEHGKKSAQLENLCEKLGDLELHDGSPGRPRKVKNFSKGDRL